MQTFAAVVDVTTAEIQNPQEFASTWGEVKQDVEAAGGTVSDTYALLGDHDFLVVYEAPDVETALQISVTAQRYGLDMETMVAIPVERMGELVDDV